MKKTAKSLWISVMALLLCFSMLLGTTYAWFTDTVESGNNVIIAGNLDVEMYWSKDLSSGNWINAEDANAEPIFNNDKWEPGYTEVRYVKIVNAGNLALKYGLSIIPDGEVSILADVIDVYYVENATENIADRNLTGLTSRGTLRDAIIGKIPVNGVLLPNGKTPANGQYAGEVVIAIALQMDKDAGNEYMNKSIGDSFSIQLVASQYNYESDSFDSDYDSGVELPAPIVDSSVSTNVTPDADNKVPAGGATLDGGSISANVPAGVQMEQGATSLTLSVSNIENSNANITLGENEVQSSIDVHMAGVATSNSVPMEITLLAVAAKGMNLGNLKLYHVENGSTTEMTYVALDAAFTAHNQFKYDPATGDIILYMATFSEVALVADTENAWEGKFDYTWYDASKTELTIANADQLAAFGAIVGGMNGQTQDSFNGKTVKLVADINLGDKESENNPDIIFYPIGYNSNDGKYEKTGVAVSTGFYAFEGTFDGNGNTIANFYQNTWEMKGDNNYYDATLQYYRDGMGLFGRVYGGTIKNLTVSNFSSDGEYTTTGVIAAYADSKAGQPAVFENIAIINCNPRVYNIGNGGIVGCAGWYSKNEDLADEKNANAIVFRNITVDQSNKISALWGTYDVSCGGILGQYYPDSKCGITFENCHVAAIMDVNNDVCANYQYYWYRYSGMLIGTIRANKTEGGYTVADPTGISVTDCTYSYGSWNEYWYCELVKNSGASYTHDYQFGRLTNIDNLSEIKSGETWLKEGNFALVSDDRKSVECYHIFKDSNGNLYRHFHDVADESNPNIYEDFDLNGDGLLNDLKEDRQRYYLPFGQVFNGLGYGVKPTYTFDGFTLVEDGTVISGSKFNVKNGADLTYRPGEKIYLKDLVELGVDLSKLSQSSLYVAASPMIDDGIANITYSRDVENWENNYFTISNDSNGTIKLVITDYFYCAPTVIYLNPEEAAAKFTANPVGEQNAYTQITLGTLFGIENGATIGNVTATVTDPAGNETTVSGTSSDWASKTIDLTKDGTWTVAIKDDDAYCSVTTVTFTVNKVDKFTKKFDKNFLYRVGNQNTVDIGNIFGEIETTVGLSSVNVTIENVAGNAAGTFTSNATWTSGTIQFAGTGVVKVTISADGANPVEINLEVVDATNITSATSYTGSEHKSYVFVKDINTSSYVNHWNCTLYGNGFTYSLNGAPTAYNSKQGHGILITQNAVIDNLVIVGDIYTGYGAFKDNDYYNTAIDAQGPTTIQNCYIANCAAPVKSRNDVTIKDTTLYGGAVANLIIMSGTVTLENVTTANFDDGRAVVGMGIVVHSDTTSANLVINGTLTQYNFLSEKNVPSDTYAKSLHEIMFKSSCSQYHFGNSPDRYVNTGIISLTSAFDENNISGTGKNALGYIGMSVSSTGINGYVYTQPNTIGSVNNNYNSENDLHKAKIQGDYLPTAKFDLGNQAVSGEDTYLKGDINGVEVRYLEGETVPTLDITKLMTVYKYKGVNYAVTAKLKDSNGNAVSAANGVVTLNAAGSYTLVFTVEDNEFYNADGTKSGKSVTRDYEVPLTVKIAEPAIEDAVITIKNAAQSGSYSGLTDKTITFNPLNAITITDAEGAVNLTTNIASTNIVYGSSSSAFAGTTTITVTYNDGRVLKIVLGKPTLNSPGSSKAITYANDGTIKSAGAVASKSATGGTWTVTSYSFTGTNGKPVTNNTVVTFTFPDKSCVTGDTLVMLADGTQKRIDQVTYEDQLLVWNFFTGEFGVVPSAIIFYHGDAEYDILNLKFSDGTIVKVINNHGFFDMEENQFVFIDAGNVEEYIGHRFAKVDGDNTASVELVGYEITQEYTGCYSIQSAMHNNFMVEGMFSLTIPHYDGWFDYFEIGEGMKYDEEKMQADIEKYGLYTYEEFAEYVTYEQFIAFNGPYLKVLVGRGVVTYDQIIDLISMYVNPEQ